MVSDRSKQSFVRGSVVEDGFYYPSRDDARPAVDANGFRHIPVAGLSNAVQFFRIRLVEPASGAGSEQVVVSAHHPRLPDAVILALDAALRSHEPGIVLSFSLEDRAGWARALADVPGSPAAAAIAIAKASAGWDESASIVVEFARGSFDVRLRYEGESWATIVLERECGSGTQHS